MQIFTTESVSEGHPDKLADQISDSILDAFLKEDKESRVACEVFLSKGLALLSGEVSSKARPDVVEIAREVMRKAGYDAIRKGLDANSCVVLPLFNTQSSNIKTAIGQGKNQGAGDQGTVFGYAVDETPEYIPLGLSLSHQLMEGLSNLRKQGYSFLWPDAKSQITMVYKDQVPQYCSHILISTQHDPDYDLKDLEKFITDELIKKTIAPEYIKEDTIISVNPGGSFVLGGPQADCGLTGRKIIVDTYGGHAPHGGGAFSGKDPSKVDRSGAYVARHIAKNLVSAGLAKKCLVQISYVFGQAEPSSFAIDTFNTSSLTSEELKECVLKNWNLKPSAIIQDLKLLDISYAPTSVYGHFGRKNPSFPWEVCNKLDKLKKPS